jgi:hypothetical protein
MVKDGLLEVPNGMFQIILTEVILYVPVIVAFIAIERCSN